MADKRKQQPKGDGRKKGVIGAPKPVTASANKLARMETRKRRLARAAARRLSEDYTYPENVYREDGSISILAGTVIRRHTKRWNAIMVRRSDASAKIDHKRKQREVTRRNKNA